jgi:hypothetical protein
MKKYTITIEVEETKKSGYMSNLVAEVNQEKAEMKIARHLNHKANEIRTEIFKDILNDLNNELSILDIDKFNKDSIKTAGGMAHFESTSLYIGNVRYHIALTPLYDAAGTTPTKYLTSTKEFKLSVYYAHRNSSTYNNTTVKNVEDMLKIMEQEIKNQLHTQL